MWATLELAGLPFVPAEIVAVVREVGWVAAVLLVPVSLLATAKLPPGTRWARALSTLVVPPAVFVLRFVV